MSTSLSMKVTAPTGDLIHPYTRVFALEMQQTDQAVKGKDPRFAELITPSGACFTHFYSCGAITGINRDQKAGWSIRVADPTGVLLLVIKTRSPELIQALEDLNPPAFVSVTGYVEPDNTKGNQGFRLVLETIHSSDREARDRWILRTSMLTLDRLDRLASHIEGKENHEDLRRVITRYNSSQKQLHVLAGIVERALSQVQEKQPETGESKPDEKETGIPDIQNIVLKLVKQHSGPRGVSIQELTGFAKKEKISEDLLLDTIRTLITDDELYQPSSGFIKIL